MNQLQLLGLTAPAASALASHLAAARGREACGLLCGSLDEPRGIAVGRSIVPLQNLATAQHSFEVDPATYRRAKADAEARGSVVLALYHSHPYGLVRPSHRDLELPKVTGLLALIVASAGDRMHAACYGYLHRRTYPVEVVAPYSPPMEAETG